MKLLKHLPNALTLSNLMLGTIALLCLVQAKFICVVVLLTGCLIADILDGALARKLGESGGLGVQLDSLADLVSFGVVPAFMVYLLPTMLVNNEMERGLHLFLTGMIATSAGLRLARFNVDTRPRHYFWGLPTPAGAVMVTGLYWAVFINHDFQSQPEILRIIGLLLPVFLAILYQVPLKLPGLKSPKSGLYTLVTIALLTVAGFVIIGPISISIGIFLYVMLGLVNLVVKWY